MEMGGVPVPESPADPPIFPDARISSVNITSSCLVLMSVPSPPSITPPDGPSTPPGNTEPETTNDKTPKAQTTVPKLIPPAVIPNGLTPNSLMPPPNIIRPRLNNTISSTLAPSTSTLPVQKRPRQKVVLAPGHSPLDWARLKSSGTDLRVSTFTLAF